ncbi:hypothetical protein OG21DRAFT_1484170 [Imleria badia]|nr:hypothetical protein OG21DRAFT_1484170 [Imleria badia]
MSSHKTLEAISTNLQHQVEGLKTTYNPYWTLRTRTSVASASIGVNKPKTRPFASITTAMQAHPEWRTLSWLGSPGVYIWDCSTAGNLLTNFNNFAERRDQEVFTTRGGYVDGTQPCTSSLQLAACLAHEQLPLCPELSVDIFTSCLTSPIDIAHRYFILTHQLPNNITPDMVMQLPGDLKDRRMPLGELNWTFPVITDTIAWITFPREVFTRLYRSDLFNRLCSATSSWPRGS